MNALIKTDTKHRAAEVSNRWVPPVSWFDPELTTEGPLRPVLTCRTAPVSPAATGLRHGGTARPVAPIGKGILRHCTKLLSLPPAERRLLARAFFWTACMRVGLWTLPLRLLLRWGASHPPSAILHPQSFPSSERIAWAVQAAARLIPGASCLTQALAARRLMASAGYPCRLRIGVGLGPEGCFRAHAWLEGEGRVLLGGRNLQSYTPLRPS